MTERRLLGPSELDEAMLPLSGWEVRNGKLHREYVFASFPEAFAFMTAAALHANALDHHPDWSNAYTRVTVDLVTHDLGGISTRDVELAGSMERLASSLAR